jgi:hypothetical protein
MAERSVQSLWDERMSGEISVGRFVWAIGIGLCLLTAAPAHGQEKGQVGITMGYPTAVGIVWHLADRVALRPDVTFAHGTDELTITTSLTFNGQPVTSQRRMSTSHTSIGSSMSGLLYLSKRDALSTFVSPRYRYSRTTTSTPVPVSVGAPVSDATSRLHGVSGSFGVQYAAARRFSVVGEVGVEYVTGRTSQQPTAIGTPPFTVSTTGFASSNHNVALRSSVGVVWYFR